MIRIFDYTKTIKDSYFIKEDSKVALFDMRTFTIHRSKGLRYQLFFLNMSVSELEFGTKQYSKVLREYKVFLSGLPMLHW